MVISSAEITALVGSWLWPMFRISGMVIAAPVFSSRNVPLRIRLILVLAITAVVAPLLPPAPAIEVFSPLSVLVIAQQLLIGIIIGFVVQMVFAAVIVAGQVVSMQIGLGFSLMVDPQNGAQTPVISQFYVLMVTLVYLALNGHLVLIEVLVDSFKTIPVGVAGLGAESFWQIIVWSSQIFAGGLAIVLPAVASILVVNIAFGIMTRAAPQLNIFAIGFPITMMLGFALMLITLPGVIPRTTNLFNDAYSVIRSIMVIGQ
ncbi:MAG: flagellar biosynthetic protein FliR [Thioalkalispiraceae bacterium]|jgi:flagellar biosynthetic protein FliR